MDDPCSNYRSILSFCSYYMEDFDYRSILVDSGSIVHWNMSIGITALEQSNHIMKDRLLKVLSLVHATCFPKVLEATAGDVLSTRVCC